MPYQPEESRIQVEEVRKAEAIEEIEHEQKSRRSLRQHKVTENNVEILATQRALLLWTRYSNIQSMLRELRYR